MHEVVKSLRNDTPLTKEETDLVVAVYEHSGNVSHASKSLWGELKHPSQKGWRIFRRPHVKAAYLAVLDRTQQHIRLYAEHYGAGFEQRIKKLAQIVTEPGPLPTDRMAAIKYLDQLEGRLQDDTDRAALPNFEALIFALQRSGGTGSDAQDAEFSEVRGEIPVDPDEGEGFAEVEVQADAGGHRTSRWLDTPHTPEG